MTDREKSRIPQVFISSTVEDLKPYRAAARDVAVAARFHPVMFNHWPAGGERRPAAECLHQVSKADVLVVITAYRYGWKPGPPDQPADEFKSITWLECDHAHRRIEVLPFLVDKDAEWPEELKDECRVTVALRQRKASNELLDEVRRDLDLLEQFHQWLQGITIRATFRNLDEFKGKLAVALRDWRDRHPEFGPRHEPLLRGDPRKYLEFLRERTQWIDIRGLQVGTGKAHRFPIRELYIPLATGRPELAEALRASRRSPAEPGPREVRQAVSLEEALAHRRLVIVGDPGAGKTTFLRRLAFELCESWLAGEPEIPRTARGELVNSGQHAARQPGFLETLAAVFRRPALKEGSRGRTFEDEEAKTQGRPFPIFVGVADLAKHISLCRARQDHDGPTTQHAPRWLLHFLKAQSIAQNWGLDEAFFREKLEGPSILLFDGLDEVGNRTEREEIARLFENTTRAYEDCRFVVTTRPLAYTGQATLDGFQTAQIEPLEPEAVEKFLEHWCQALFPNSPTIAEDHLAELSGALRGSLEIRRMARNPVMLTALAVVHWNERRLPEQRADLYGSVLNWLARSREKREGRTPAERCLALLEHLALAMQKQSKGRLVQVSKGQAADLLASQFAAEGEAQRLRQARDFIVQEELDSGIIVSRGSEIRFWHLTFQEYLAAKAISGLVDRDQHQLLLGDDRIYRPEWREVALLLAGVLREQGVPKVDGLISEILKRLSDRASLAQQAKCVGLIGAMVRDLRPLEYEPADPRYKQALHAVLGIFDAEQARGVDFKVRLEAAEALGQAGDPRLQRDNWITIEAGTFLMGAQKTDPSKPGYDPEAYNDESPVHEVQPGVYQIGRYPVTVEEYGHFIKDEGYLDDRWWSAGGLGKNSEPQNWDQQTLHPNRPVVNVSWYEAAAYCAWAGVRLPTETEWERAARGVKGRKYPWGNEEPDVERANFDADKVGHATPVGLYPRGATPDGILDMAANVREWVADWYEAGYYKTSPWSTPRGPERGKSRGIRGGSCFDASRHIRTSFRLWDEPVLRSGSVGFRCVREVAT